MCMQHLLNITKSLEKIERLMQGSRISQGGPSKELDKYVIKYVVTKNYYRMTYNHLKK